jgi:hypothetical protein
MNAMTKRSRLRALPATLLVAATATALTALGTGAAHADPAPATPNTSDVTAANAAAVSSLGTVGKFFASGGQQPQGSAAALTAAAQIAAPKLDSATVPVYYLDRAFVTGPTSNTPVASLVFMATDAVSTSGAHASVWTAKTPTGWQVVNIATGSDETAFSAQAAKTGPGATAFEEPQIGAWYALRGGRVLPLNPTAQTSVGAGGMTVAQYQALVRTRYADKLPGSAYDRNGMAGGFNPGTKADSVPGVAAAAAPAAAPAAESVPATAKPTSADDTLLLTSGVTAIALASAGLGYAAYRRVLTS